MQDLVFFPLPDVVWALSPAVRAALVDTILTFEPVKPSTLAHEETFNTLMTLPFSLRVRLGFGTNGITRLKRFFNFVEMSRDFSASIR
jgi:hypothetical protein